jgi:hypothetical protein
MMTGALQVKNDERCWIFWAKSIPGNGKTRTFGLGNLVLVYGSPMEHISELGCRQTSQNFGSMEFVRFLSPAYGNANAETFPGSWSWENHTHVSY